ncbi:MAG TPA: M48 family metalloprotease [Gaiellaceae bacterium]|nr:M48 family metalloprotease [Gaiellaceae bacterium]
MTATRMGVRLRLATLTALAGAWAAAAFFLWTSTKVPDGLHLGGLPEQRFFSASFLRRAEHYEQFGYWLWLGQTVATLVVFALYAWRGARFSRESAAGPIGTGMLLAMLGFALVWLVSIPFTVLSLWWQRRYDQSHESYVTVVFGGWLALAAEFLFLSFAVLVVVGFAKWLPRAWWIPGAAVFVGLAALFTFVSPYLVPDTHALRNPDLRAAAARIAEREGVHGVPVEVQDVDTKDANAFTTGIGSSRKVFLWSSLLDGRFTNREIEVVLAHEYGHQARDHLLKGIAWYALFAFPGTYLIAVAARRRGGMREPAAMPLAILVLVALSFAALPLENAVSRHVEAEADWMALRTTRDPGAMQSLFRRFASTSLGDPSPPTVAYLAFENHPTLMQRIAMARAWHSRQVSPAARG